MISMKFLECRYKMMIYKRFQLFESSFVGDISSSAASYPLSPASGPENSFDSDAFLFSISSKLEE